MNFRPFIYVVAGGLLGLVGVQAWKIVHAPSTPLAALENQPPVVDQRPLQDFVPVIDPAMLVASSPAVEPDAAPTMAPRKQAMADIDNIQFSLRDFRTRMGGNPTGTNAEIMKSMMGDNASQARFVPAEGMRLNENGELTDRWGTPYFFHQLSMNEMEIRSAGPDHKLWTQDDLIAK